MKVKATEKGYAGLQIRAVGDVFEVEDKVFDAHWMKKVGDDGEDLAEEPKEEPKKDEPKKEALKTEQPHGAQPTWSKPQPK